MGARNSKFFGNLVIVYSDCLYSVVIRTFLQLSFIKLLLSSPPPSFFLYDGMRCCRSDLLALCCLQPLCDVTTEFILGF